jgi:hypothetical protein
VSIFQRTAETGGGGVLLAGWVAEPDQSGAAIVACPAHAAW